MPERRSLRDAPAAVRAAARSVVTRLREGARTAWRRGTGQRGAQQTGKPRRPGRGAGGGSPEHAGSRFSPAAVAAALAAGAAVTVGVVVLMLTVLPGRVDTERREARDELSRIPSELRVPEWQLPDSTEVLQPPILMIRGESGPWDRSEIEPFMYDSVDAVREHLRRENEAALRRLFSRVP